MGEQAFKDHAKPVDTNALKGRRRRQLERTGKTKIGPNEKCPCNSGKKFKKCCAHKSAEPEVEVDTSKPLTQEMFTKAIKTGRFQSKVPNEANEGKT